MKDLVYGVKEFQAHVSAALRAVQEGRRVLVLSHDRLIAEVIKPRKQARKRKMSALDRKLERLYESGRLLRPTKSGPIPPFKGVPMPGILEEFLANRR